MHSAVLPERLWQPATEEFVSGLLAVVDRTVIVRTMQQTAFGSRVVPTGPVNRGFGLFGFVMVERVWLVEQ